MEQGLKDTIPVGKVAGVLLLYITLGAAFYRTVEGFRWLDAYYYVVVTLSTIGYGDFVPKTDAGKIFTIFYIVFGVVVFAGSIRYLLVSWQKNREKRKNK